jgi:hypothetical protein
VKYISLAAAAAARCYWPVTTGRSSCAPRLSGAKNLNFGSGAPDTDRRLPKRAGRSRRPIASKYPAPLRSQPGAGGRHCSQLARFVCLFFWGVAASSHGAGRQILTLGFCFAPADVHIGASNQVQCLRRQDSLLVEEAAQGGRISLRVGGGGAG